jgi:hypothetical protein
VRQLALDRLNVEVDLLRGEHRPRAGPAGGIPDEARSTTGQRDWMVAVPSKPGHHHDRHEVTDMEAIGRGVEAPIQRQRRLEPLPQHFFLGGLIDKATILEHVK